VLYFLRLGTLGLATDRARGLMQRDPRGKERTGSRGKTIFRRPWPFPNCVQATGAQLAKVPWMVHSGTLGATLTGAAFVLPSFLMVLALASLYVHFGQLAWDPGDCSMASGACRSSRRSIGAEKRQNGQLISEDAGHGLSVVGVCSAAGDHDYLDTVGSRLVVRVVRIPSPCS